MQAVCEWGHDTIESWGRKRRSVSNKTELMDEKEEDMTLSQEILVLDFGDEKQADFFKNSAEFNGKSTCS